MPSVQDVNRRADQWIDDPTLVPTELVGWGALGAARRLHAGIRDSVEARVNARFDRVIVRAAAHNELSIREATQ